MSATTRNSWPYWNWKWCGNPSRKNKWLDQNIRFFSLERPIDFESADKQPVDLVFTLLAPEDNSGTEHLKALAMVSRIFSDKNIRSQLRSSENTRSLFAILTSNEFKSRLISRDFYFFSLHLQLLMCSLCGNLLRPKLYL